MAEVDGRMGSQSEKGGLVEKVGRKCKPCLNKHVKRTADVFCPSCEEFQCNDCSNAHTIYDVMKDHELLTIPEGLSYVAKTLDLKGLDVCTKHDKPYEFFCKRDKSLACSTCAIMDHKKCKKIVDIESLSKHGQCETLRDKLLTAVTTTNRAVDILREAESCLSDDIEIVPIRLAEMRKTIIQRCDEFAENVTQDAKSYRDKTIAEWAESKLECENKLKLMKLSFDMIDTIATNGTPSQQFITMRSLTETVKNAESLCTDVQTLNVSCDFAPQFSNLKSNLLCEINHRVFKMKYNIPKMSRLEPITSIDLKRMSDDEYDPCYTGSDFLPDGRLVVGDNRNGKCLLYDENLRLMTVYKLPYIHPKGVVVVSEDEVAILTAGRDRKLYFLHVSQSNQISLNRTCKLSLQYSTLSMKDNENFVVSTLDHTPPVRIVSMSGEEKDFDIVFPSKEYPSDTSSCTYIRSQDKVVLTDAESDTVYIYDVSTGEKCAIKQKHMQPHSVTVGPYDHLFVGKRDETSSIVEMTPAGRILATHQVDMCYPRVLAVSKDRRMAVSNAHRGAPVLKLYRIH